MQRQALSCMYECVIPSSTERVRGLHCLCPLQPRSSMSWTCSWLRTVRSKEPTAFINCGWSQHSLSPSCDQRLSRVCVILCTWYGSVLRSKNSRKPVANSQKRKLWVSLMVRRHQYVLLLALVQAQNGPTVTHKHRFLFRRW